MRKALLNAGIMVTAWLAVCPVALAAFPGANGKLAFDSTRDGDHEIFTMNADGSGQTNLTNNATLDAHPAWSPDGTKLAFESNREGPYEIYTMNADGSDQRNITNSGPIDFSPDWSPDGTKIAFVRDSEPSYEIYTMNADGSGQTNITNSTEVDSGPAWSPDGTKIAFSRDSDIYTMNADGSDQTHLTTIGSTNHSRLDWSPDGTKIAFSFFNSAGTHHEIYTVDADGSDGTLVTLRGASPAWSPDGTKIAFHSQRDGNYEIYTMNADGSDQTNVTNRSLSDYYVDWQPVVARGYPRPKSAGTYFASLVPSFAPCASPNRQHGPPLAEPSCAPPVQQSPRVTVGTPDANTGAANFSGAVVLDVIPGVPSTAADEADVLIRAVIADVRCIPPSTTCGSPNDSTSPPDYVGALAGAVTLRITDRNNAPFPDPVTGKGPGTVQDQTLTFTIPCSATTSTSRGSACNLDTTADALIPGSVVEKQRANWELGEVRVLDGGADGDPGTPDGPQVFLRQGVFVP